MDIKFRFSALEISVAGKTTASRHRSRTKPCSVPMAGGGSGVTRASGYTDVGSWQVAGCAPGLLRLKGCGSTAGLGQLVIPVPIQDRHV